MKLDNVNIDNQEILITPEELKRQLPATEEVKRGISQNREIVRSIIDGTDKRLLLVVGRARFTTREKLLIMQRDSRH